MSSPKTKNISEFEVISNNDKSCESSDDEHSSVSEARIDTDMSEVSNNTLFFHELYKDNRTLLRELAEKEKLIVQLQERNSFLVNSNMFWLCCTVGSMFSSLITLRFTH